PELGRRRVLEREQQAESDRFDPAISNRFRELDRVVDRLTNEQYEVITRLRGTPRALISGTAGSGKTLVAAEKAIRLSAAGIQTLFLCHNPLLADWVEHELVYQSGVVVRAFEEFVRQYAIAPAQDVPAWSNYSQPPAEQLRAAVAAL